MKLVLYINIMLILSDLNFGVYNVGGYSVN